MPGKVIFVTGTDTGVGKTVFTALMLDHLRASGAHALALKPFCCGQRSDARVLHSLQQSELTLDEVNPHWFSAPVAPLVAARQQRRAIALKEVRKLIKATAARCECLLVEGAGGLLVPLGEEFTLLNLIDRSSGLVVVSRNKLGTLNHTLLTFAALGLTDARGACDRRCALLMMQQERADASATSNPAFLRRLIKQVPLFLVPYLGLQPLSPRYLQLNRKKIQKTLARIFEIISV